MLLGHRRIVALGVFFCGLAGLPPRAAAGPVEQVVQLAMHPTDPEVMLVRYVNGGDGMLRTRDGGKSWQMACNAMLLGPQSRSGTTLIAGDGSPWMGVFDGLWHGDAQGCDWQRESRYEGEWVGDLAVDPTDPSIVFAVTSTASSTEPKLNGVLRRDASGLWSDFGVKDDMLATRLFVVAHGDGLRMYVSAIKGQLTPAGGGTPQPNYVTRVSDDGGATWQEFVLGTVGGTFRLQGVDPTNADRIVATISRESDGVSDAGDDSVLVSSDRGEHFSESMKVSQVGGVAFAPDGRLWIGDLGDVARATQAPGALWFAPSLDAPPARLPMATYPVQCLGYNAASDTLYACQHFAFGTVDAQSGAFNALFKLTEVREFLQCDGVDSAAACEPQLCGAYCGFSHFGVAPLCQVYDTPTCGAAVAKVERPTLAPDTGATGGVPATPDAGAGGSAMRSANLSDDAPALGAAGAAGGEAPKRKVSDCSVTALGAQRAQLPLAACAALLPLWLARGRRRRRARGAAQCVQRKGSASSSSIG